MNEQSGGHWEAYVRETARAFSYPPTPHLSTAVQVERSRMARPAGRPLYRWRLAQVLTLALLVIGSLMAVPQVRASVLAALRIGAIRILLVEPTPTATLLPETPTPEKPLPTPLASMRNLAGETTLAEAQAALDFQIRLPTHPQELGPPEQVFLQNIGGPVVVLVWLDDQQPDRVRLSLHILAPGVTGTKGHPSVIQETIVNGQSALWTQGPYLLRLGSGGYQNTRLVEGNVLLWADDEEITYRLESGLSLEEAIQIAESLK